MRTKASVREGWARAVHRIEPDSSRHILHFTQAGDATLPKALQICHTRGSEFGPLALTNGPQTAVSMPWVSTLDALEVFWSMALALAASLLNGRLQGSQT